MRTIIITKMNPDGTIEKHISIDGDEEQTAFVLDMLGMIRNDFETTDAPEPTLQ